MVRPENLEGIFAMSASRVALRLPCLIEYTSWSFYVNILEMFWCLRFQNDCFIIILCEQCFICYVRDSYVHGIRKPDEHNFLWIIL